MYVSLRTWHLCFTRIHLLVQAEVCLSLGTYIYFSNVARVILYTCRLSPFFSLSGIRGRGRFSDACRPKQIRKPKAVLQFCILMLFTQIIRWKEIVRVAYIIFSFVLRRFIITHKCYTISRCHYVVFNFLILRFCRLE